MDETMDEVELQKTIREKEAHGRAVVLEMIGDLPEADVKPPENVLFICKLNPVTQVSAYPLVISAWFIPKEITEDEKTFITSIPPRFRLPLTGIRLSAGFSQMLCHL